MLAQAVLVGILVHIHVMVSCRTQAAHTGSRTSSTAASFVGHNSHTARSVRESITDHHAILRAIGVQRGVNWGVDQYADSREHSMGQHVA